MSLECRLLYAIVTIICNIQYVLLTNNSVEKLLSDVQQTISETYVLPKDNSKLIETSDSRVYEFGTFDFIVIGAGAAGCVVANRLSEINSWNVLLLEAGGEDDDVTDITGLNALFAYSDKNWGYNTTSSDTICQKNANHECLYVRGKVRGGTTTINEGIYARGHPSDYDLWAEMGNQGWSYEDVLPYFIKSEHADFPNRDLKSSGIEGYLHVNQTPSNPTLERVLTQGYQEIGIKKVNDYNSREQIGISKVQVMINFNKRHSSARAFLDPIKDRQNLKVSLNSFVTKVLVQKNTQKTYGVEFIKEGKRFVALAKNEIILSAGVINTPQILMLSGIGPKTHLNELKIPFIKDLPVGKNMEDHQSIKFKFQSNNTFYNFTLKENIERYFKGLKPFASRLEMISFINFENNTNNPRPEVEIYIAVFSGDPSNHNETQKLHGIRFTLVNLHSTTKGEITLKSNSPLDFPNIPATDLAYPNDMEMFYKGIQYLIALNNTRAFQEYKLWLDIPPIPNCEGKNYTKLSKKWWYCAIKMLTLQGSHGIGTARMGNDTKTSVVNERLQVHGIQGLRVIDGSAIPEIVSGHTWAPITMVAEKGSDMIKKDYKKTK